MLSFNVGFRRYSNGDSSNAGKPVSLSERLRRIAYSMDILVPGFYFWLGSFTLQIGGCKPDDNPYRYPGTLNSFFGMAIVFPGYYIVSTYRDTYDPREARH